MTRARLTGLLRGLLPGILLALLLGGCGLKGELYLPEPPARAPRCSQEPARDSTQEEPRRTREPSADVEG